MFGCIVSYILRMEYELLSIINFEFESFLFEYALLVVKELCVGKISEACNSKNGELKDIRYLE
jgi:hypothetical protein